MSEPLSRYMDFVQTQVEALRAQAKSYTSAGVALDYYEKANALLLALGETLRPPPAYIWPEGLDQMQRRGEAEQKRDKLRAALEGLRNNGCWCETAERIRDFNGEHSPQCKAAQEALGAA